MSRISFGHTFLKRKPQFSRWLASYDYIDRVLSWDEYIPLLRALGKAKIIEPGYVDASIANGATQLRKERFDLHEEEAREELLEPLKEFLE